MTTLDDVRRLALALPDTQEDAEGYSFSVQVKGKQKGFAWVWREKSDPKKPRIPRQDVLAVRVDSELQKQMLIAADPVKFFTEPHYNGYPAVLVRLREIDAEELHELLAEGWQCLQPPPPRHKAR